TESLDLLIRLTICNALDQHRHTPGRGEPAHVPVPKSDGTQLAFDAVRERFGQSEQRFRRKLLRADLYQKVTLCHLLSIEVLNVLALCPRSRCRSSSSQLIAMLAASEIRAPRAY